MPCKSSSWGHGDAASSIRRGHASDATTAIAAPGMRATATWGPLTTLLKTKVAMFCVAVMPAFLQADVPAALFGARSGAFTRLRALCGSRC